MSGSDASPPKEFMAYHSDPKKKMFSGSIIMKNVPGALAAVSTILAENGLNLIASESTNIRATGDSVWGFFAEAEKEGLTASTVKRSLDSSPVVLKSCVDAGFSGVVIDKYHYPLQFTMGQKAVIFQRGDIINMFGRLRHVFQTGAAVMIYEMGLAAGQSDARDLIENLGKHIVQNNLDEIVFLYSATGWGRPELVDLQFEPFRARLRISDNFECSEMRSKTPNSHYIRGHLSGFVSLIFEKKNSVRERKCIAMGDPYCEFEVTEEEVTP